MLNKLSLITLCWLLTVPVFAQDPHRFDAEIQQLNKIDVPEEGIYRVFTGSSSVRMWNTLADDCSGLPLVNTGFGGSQTSDLLYFLDDLVLRFKPKQVFVYEGDNDIADGKKPETIMETTKKLAQRILDHDPEIQVFFISAKPSPSRWGFKEQYVVFNALLKEYCTQTDRLNFVDVWNPMLNKAGKPKPEIFIEDSLHMNSMGYTIWKNILCNTDG